MLVNHVYASWNEREVMLNFEDMNAIITNSCKSVRQNQLSRIKQSSLNRTLNTYEPHKYIGRQHSTIMLLGFKHLSSSSAVKLFVVSLSESVDFPSA